MGIPPDAAKKLTYWEYTALIWEWNERHKPEGSDVEPASPDQVRRAFAKIPDAVFGRAN